MGLWQQIWDSDLCKTVCVCVWVCVCLKADVLTIYDVSLLGTRVKGVVA